MNKLFSLRILCPYCPEAKLGTIIANLRLPPGEKIHVVDKTHMSGHTIVLDRVFGESKYYPAAIISKEDVVRRFDSYFVRKENKVFAVGVYDFLHFCEFIKKFKGVL